MKMTNFERKPLKSFDENPFWGFIQGHGSVDLMKDFEDK